jgi:hypothetical protein
VPVATEINRPQAGMGATEHLITDSIPYVITRVSKSGKTIWLRKVETGEAQILYKKGDWPVTISEGLLDKPYGPELQFTLTARGWTRKGSKPLTIGHARRRVDYSM